MPSFPCLAMEWATGLLRRILCFQLVLISFSLHCCFMGLYVDKSSIILCVHLEKLKSSVMGTKQLFGQCLVRVVSSAHCIAPKFLITVVLHLHILIRITGREWFVPCLLCKAKTQGHLARRSLAIQVKKKVSRWVWCNQKVAIFHMCQSFSTVPFGFLKKRLISNAYTSEKLIK